MNKAVISESQRQSSSGGQIVIQYITVTDNARASGIEIILAPAARAHEFDRHCRNVSQVSLNGNPIAGASYNV